MHDAAAADLRDLYTSIDELLGETAAAEVARTSAIGAATKDRRASARNLAHYLAVRAHDLRPLQLRLAALSLSSLGRMEAAVQHTLCGVRHALLALAGHRAQPGPPPELPPDRAAQLLAQNSVAALGRTPAGRTTRIMVTLPSAAARDPRLLHDLLAAGTDLVRINLAHDDAAAWTAMVGHLRTAMTATGRPCRVLADLPGPKLRTGPLPPGPQVVKFRPERDALGRVTAPATIVFVDPEQQVPGPGLPIPVSAPLAPFAAVDDEIVLRDTRGRQRRLPVIAVGGNHVIASTDRTTYFATDMPVQLRRQGASVCEVQVGPLPALPGEIELQVGDLLLVHDGAIPGSQATPGPGGDLQPASIGCTLPAVFAAARVGHRILFDDGRFAGTVIESDGRQLRVRITETPPGGGHLRAEKGINLPDTDLQTAALTDYDLDCLDWVTAHADLVGMSFVHRPVDVLQLQEELRRRDRPELGIVLKIETEQGFQHLPDLLFAGLAGPPLGVMVARGDLAVEVGYARLAEVQEEILWLCEAAHTPVIWATQVLDGMARSGVPSRAEVTDAAMGVRAECVMLNKGAHIVDTACFLDDLLHRMQEHHLKKRSLLRRLRVAGHPLSPPAANRTDNASG
ncbi:MAG: hypothetical protein IPK26_29415 [Planctomycetes bacterium]|nr:hypothetical protein [Planctomycetota bacterium]